MKVYSPDDEVFCAEIRDCQAVLPPNSVTELPDDIGELLLGHFKARGFVAMTGDKKQDEKLKEQAEATFNKFLLKNPPRPRPAHDETDAHVAYEKKLARRKLKAA